ncbi:MAG: LysM peptidoglycan-binding domain-containing protein [Akkermansia sp.]|nr:LysM peptidoglycan-binding domain-containing protein [Akkermansia sp.]MBQ8376133.1 LysM peptidoglycan-binding domain-containing protein [Akkermansia sp.]
MASADVPLRVNQQLRIAAAGSAVAPAAVPAAPISPRPAAPAPTSQGGTYTVQAGDTLYRIARQHGVNPAALMQANGLTPETANKIRVGTKLRIPKAP